MHVAQHVGCKLHIEHREPLVDGDRVERLACEPIELLVVVG